GWLAVTGTSLAIPWLGALAAFGSAALLFATLLLAFELTLPPAELSHFAHAPGANSPGAEHGRPALGPDERARLTRIMNLSRVATRAAAQPLLRLELREALAQETFATWPSLRQLEEVLDAGAFN